LTFQTADLKILRFLLTYLGFFQGGLFRKGSISMEA